MSWPGPGQAGKLPRTATEGKWAAAAVPAWTRLRCSIISTASRDLAYALFGCCCFASFFLLVAFISRIAIVWSATREVKVIEMIFARCFCCCCVYEHVCKGVSFTYSSNEFNRSDRSCKQQRLWCIHTLFHTHVWSSAFHLSLVVMDIRSWFSNMSQPFYWVSEWVNSSSIQTQLFWNCSLLIEALEKKINSTNKRSF